MTPQIAALQEIAEFLEAEKISYAPEDLIIHKAVAGRGHDRRDILAILERQGAALDLKYVRHWLAEFDAALGVSEPSATFESILFEFPG